MKTSAKTENSLKIFLQKKLETKNFSLLLDEFSDTHRQVIESFLVYISFMHDRFVAQREKLHRKLVSHGKLHFGFLSRKSSAGEFIIHKAKKKV